jgi:hypothetical protein
MPLHPVTVPCCSLVRFQKLYSDFKSERFYWRMILLARKLMLVSTTIMFNQLPLFQVRVAIRPGCGLPCPGAQALSGPLESQDPNPAHALLAAPTAARPAAPLRPCDGCCCNGMLCCVPPPPLPLPSPSPAQSSMAVFIMFLSYILHTWAMPFLTRENVPQTFYDIVNAEGATDVRVFRPPPPLLPLLHMSSRFV